MSVPRVAILHQGFVPHYRVRFFELLSERPGVEYVVIHGEPPSGEGHTAATGPFAFANIRVRSKELRVAGKSLVLQDARPVVAGKFDALVLGTHLLFPANHVLLAVFRATGRPVLYWGHGQERAEPNLKKRLARLATRYLAYSAGGADWLVAQGLSRDRVDVVRNTLDMRAQLAAHASVLAEDECALRADLGFDSAAVVFVYVGRIYKEKRVGELVSAVSRLRQQGLNVEAAIIGGGPEEANVRSAAAHADGVQMLGEVYDAARIARYLRVAAAVVNPGRVGLAVNHALAQGRPMITRADNAHSPEIEFLEDGVNALVVAGDVRTFEERLAEFARSPEQQKALQQGALRARERLGLEEMVDAFDNAVRTALATSRRPFVKRGAR